MFDSYVSINKKFKSSVNLQYDLSNEEKILEYIPTTDLCDVLKKYVKTALFGEGNKASFLVGPYGKGKSYLMLMLTYLFSKKTNKVLFKKIVNKIGKIDQELSKLLVLMDKSNLTFLPVIINNNDSDDLNQNFMLALRKALINNGLNSIVPESTFTDCINQIENWESNEDLNLLEICENKLKVNLKQLKNGLKEYSKDSYNTFLKVFECINHGYKYHTLIGNDFADMYFSVAKSLINYGYKGMFVIFDEFGVFLEHRTEDFNVRMNKIQAFAERCSSIDNNIQMHFCCIMHKDIGLYLKDKTYSNDFEKISGRYSHIRFDRSLDENYQIICNAIEKKKNYSLVLNNAKKDYKDFLSRVKKSNIFNDENQINFIFENGYPFNPISMYVLIQISEKIAQNERTLFTFLSDSDLYSFRYFITNNDKGLLNVDYIYNYFQMIIKNNEEYKSIYYKVDSLSKIDLRTDHHNIFKCIALMKIINDDIKFSINERNIALALAKSEDEIQQIIEELISSNVLKRNITNNAIDFDILADSEINKLIETTTIKKVDHMTNCELLSKFDNDRYMISNKYNFEYSMTRYFYAIYMDLSDFKKLNSFNILLKEAKADGVIINLLNSNQCNINEIMTILNSDKSIDSYKIIVRIYHENVGPSVILKLKRLFASELLIEEKNTLNEISIESLKMSVEDISNEVKDYLKEYHLHGICISKNDFEEHDIKKLIYGCLIKTYPETIVFNNEQINKQIISSTSIKARNNVIDNILGNTSIQYGPTSAEGTILSSFEHSLENSNEVIDKLQKLIINSSGKICSFELVKMLTEYPYGMRKGVIPLFIAKALAMMNVFEKNNVQTVVFYNDTIQIKVDASNLTKMMNNPSRYYFSFKKVNKERIRMVELIANHFNIKISHNFNYDAENIVKGLRTYVSNLEPVIVKSSLNDNLLALTENELAFKDLFLRHDISTYDLLCDELGTFGNKSAEIIGNIVIFTQAYKSKVCNLYNNIIYETKQIFSNNDNESLKTNYNSWKHKYPYVTNIIFDGLNKKTFNALERLQYNDTDAIDSLSIALLDCTLNDWNENKHELFFKYLKSFVEFVEKCKYEGIAERNDIIEDISNEPLSQLGTTLYSNLQDILDEYGSSISNKEKIDILKRLVNEIIK